MKLPPLVEVTWVDAWASLDGYDAEEIERNHHGHETHSTGYLVRSNSQGVMLAADIDFDDGEPKYDRVSFLPRGMVVKVRRLR